MTASSTSPMQVMISGCQFIGNHIRNTSTRTFGGAGSAIIAYSLDITIQDSIFMNNYMEVDGNGFGLHGTVYLSFDGDFPYGATIRNTTFDGNIADEGGALFMASAKRRKGDIDATPATTITDCRYLSFVCYHG